MINVKDTDTHFIIDGSTRLVKNESETKSMLVQYDHNSERFTFRVPRYVDGHDLSQCKTDTRVHFINIDKTKRTENHGTYPVDDVDVCPEDEEYVICSWLITRNATQLAGSLHFVIEFALKGEDGNVIYSWNTAKYTGITISDGINFDNQTVEENNDLLTRWEKELKDNHITKMEQTKSSLEDNGENVWTATFGNGTTADFKVRNGSRGETGYVGSIETIDKQPLHFFVGTKAQYDALPNEKKANLFAIITDDENKAKYDKLVEDLDNNNLTVDGAIKLKPNIMVYTLSDEGTLDIKLDGNCLYAIDVTYPAGSSTFMLCAHNALPAISEYWTVTSYTARDRWGQCLEYKEVYYRDRETIESTLYMLDQDNNFVRVGNKVRIAKIF